MSRAIALSETSGSALAPLPDTSTKVGFEASVFLQRQRCPLPKPVFDRPTRMSLEFVGFTLIDVMAANGKAVVPEFSFVQLDPVLVDM